MNRIYLVLLSVVMLSGCASIDQSLLLNKGTKIEISDVSTTTLVSTSLASGREEVDLIKKRILELTREELAKRSIEAFLLPTTGAAILKYDIRTVALAYKVRYRVSLETPEGKVIFAYQDDEDNDEIDDVFENIASSAANNVARSFKNN